MFSYPRFSGNIATLHSGKAKIAERVSELEEGLKKSEQREAKQLTSADPFLTCANSTCATHVYTSMLNIFEQCLYMSLLVHRNSLHIFAHPSLLFIAEILSFCCMPLQGGTSGTTGGSADRGGTEAGSQTVTHLSVQVITLMGTEFDSVNLNTLSSEHCNHHSESIVSLLAAGC